MFSATLILFSPPVTLLSIFVHDPATTEFFPLSLHDALPILPGAPRVRAPACRRAAAPRRRRARRAARRRRGPMRPRRGRSEEDTSELQSPMYLVGRLRLGKKKGAIAYKWTIASRAELPLADA